jgi:predicted CXXCH cytochrome family protein
MLLALCALPAQSAERSWVGSAACADCHAEAYRAWQGSHHFQAMRPADETSVLGAFDGRRFEYAGTTSRFFREDGRYIVETDDENGNLQTFEVAYTFGFHPLQQYLIAFPGGRYQALNIVWDSRVEEQGGQRWIHLYPEDSPGGDPPVTHRDIVHWTGSFQNWNGRCAACHSTGLEKNYSSASRSYSTTWREINVACEACHGPAGAHIRWAQDASAASEGSAKEPPPNRGFAISLSDRGAFGQPPNGAGPTLARLDEQRPSRQLSTCAACHARRSELDDHDPEALFGDLYRLSLIEPGLYFPDGQILEEVYVYGSFLQSKMHAAGVVCSDCHEPHGTTLRADGNALCTRCHSAPVFDKEAHHRHEAQSTGAACVNCHMPTRSYMVVDDRHDHSFRIPDPALSEALGVPNACNGCHLDRDPKWAVQSMQQWQLPTQPRSEHASILADAWAGRPAALPGLLGLAADESRPPIIRASAVLATTSYSLRETLPTVVQLLYADDHLIRQGAVRALEPLPPEQRLALLGALMTDSRKSVRMAVARQLADASADELAPGDARALHALRQEYLETLRHNADFPEEQLNTGLFHAASGDPAAAEKAYREALSLAPAFVPALLNLADLYRANGLDAQARPLLQRAIEQAPDLAAPQHAMGLLLIRQRDLDAAVPYLQRAARLEPGQVRYVYVYGVALWEAGRRTEAIAALEQALEEHPGNPDLTSALATYYREVGDAAKLEQLLR